MDRSEVADGGHGHTCLLELIAAQGPARAWTARDWPHGTPVRVAGRYTSP
ncbi:hypothetical protein [Streptomyces sp. NPDC046385]